jgi:hypothetical protein
LIGAVNVTLDYYDVSDELLNDDEFKVMLTEAGVDPRTYTKGFFDDK